MSNSNDYAKIVAKSWTDDKFRAALLADPKGTLKKEGWGIPDSLGVKVTADASDNTLVLGLPKKPAGLNDEQLRKHADSLACCTHDILKACC
jgi:hypothetical protein